MGKIREWFNHPQNSWGGYLLVLLLTVPVNELAQFIKYRIFSEESKLTINHYDYYDNTLCYQKMTLKNHSNDIVNNVSFGWQNVASNTLVKIKGPYINDEYVIGSQDYITKPITMLRTHKYETVISFQGDCSIGATPVIYINNHGIDID